MPLGAGTYSPIEISLRDKGGEIGTFGAFGLLIDDTTFVANQTKRDNFVVAVNLATLGTLVSHNYGGLFVIVNPVAKASSPSAQRENKILIRYHDNITFEKQTATLPTVDLPNLVFEADANDFVSLASPSFMSGLVTAWQAFIVNPRTGNLTTIDSAEYVGRNR